ncbi:peptidase [Bacterioplanes sanyensis]|uniref:Peptidase n=1 Tax=Bacterioplanes sanyensis TaxID=1249553 RepID=A0A222FIU6_9GAMM|nr:zinc metallopeptidase [Bacterioplanes sanyensis]ASP38414.1 peptidase [Bacterioplanes sanyensis]
MVWLVVLVGVLALLLGPSLWVRHVMKRHSHERRDYPGTGGDMARHLINQLQLQQVGLESTEQGDHYDPRQRMVRLSQDNLDGKSLTAVAVAAHEVGHAIQHAKGESLFQLRTVLAHVAVWSERIIPILLLALPLLAWWQPGLSRWSLILAVAAMLISTLVHLVTLPVEWDASFGKALPLLQQGGYLSEQDMQGARQILCAAALTYVAGSLISLLNVWRWWRYLK